MDMDLTPAQQELQEELEAVRRNLPVGGYETPIGELLSLYEDGNLITAPDKPGAHDINKEQKTRIIENLLIGLPAPSITVLMDKTGRYELIEGEQWLKTVFQFMGKIETRYSFRMENPRILKSAAGFAWSEDSFSKTPEKFLSVHQRTDLKRVRVKLNIIASRDNQPVREYYN